MAQRRKLLGRILAEMGVVTEEQLTEALDLQHTTSGNTGGALVSARGDGQAAPVTPTDCFSGCGACMAGQRCSGGLRRRSPVDIPRKGPCADPREQYLWRRLLVSLGNDFALARLLEHPYGGRVSRLIWLARREAKSHLGNSGPAAVIEPVTGKTVAQPG